MYPWKSTGAKDVFLAEMSALQPKISMDAVSEYPLGGKGKHRSTIWPGIIYKTLRVAWYPAVHCLNTSCASARSWRRRLRSTAILRVPVALQYPPCVLASENAGNAPHAFIQQKKEVAVAVN